MSEPATLRKLAFSLGVFAFITSVSLLIASAARARHIQGYLQQADAAVPWVQAGTLSVAIALILGFFGRGKARITSVSLSFLLLLCWGLIGVSLY